ALEDVNALNESGTITIVDPFVSDPATMRPLASRTVNFTTVDNDTQAIVVQGAPDPVILSEGGGTQGFVVRLAFDPVIPTPLSLTPSLPGQVAVGGGPCVLS